MSKPLNATFEKFGWPRTKIAEGEHWGVMVRPAQPTLGSLVLACKEPVFAFSAVSAEGFIEFGQMIKNIESMLSQVVGYQKINHLMLMMADKDVHFHVLPRYEGSRSWEDFDFLDDGWPGQPNLGHVVKLNEQQQSDLAVHLRTYWMN